MGRSVTLAIRTLSVLLSVLLALQMLQPRSNVASAAQTDAAVQIATSVQNLTTGSAVGDSVSASPGDQLQFTLSYNMAAAGAHAVLLDQLNAGLTYVGGSCQPVPCDLSGNTLRFGPFLSVTQGQVTFKVTVSASVGDVTILNSVSVSTSVSVTVTANTTKVVCHPHRAVQTCQTCCVSPCQPQPCQTCCLSPCQPQPCQTCCQQTCNPCVYTCSPCVSNCNPCVTNCNPCVTNCNPCVSNCNPCVTNCNPCVSNCNPCVTNCNPCVTSCQPISCLNSCSVPQFNGCSVASYGCVGSAYSRTVTVCGTVSTYQAATATTSGYITINGESFILMPYLVSSGVSITTGTSYCFTLTINGYCLITAMVVSTNVAVTNYVCGVVTPFTTGYAPYDGYLPYSGYTPYPGYNPSISGASFGPYALSGPDAGYYGFNGPLVVGGYPFPVSSSVTFPYSVSYNNPYCFVQNSTGAISGSLSVVPTAATSIESASGTRRAHRAGSV